MPRKAADKTHDDARWVTRKFLSRWMLGDPVPLGDGRVVASMILSGGKRSNLVDADGMLVSPLYDGIISELAFLLGKALAIESDLGRKVANAERQNDVMYSRYVKIRNKFVKADAAAQRWRKRTPIRKKEHHLKQVALAAENLSRMYFIPRELPPEYFDPVPPME